MRKTLRQNDRDYFIAALVDKESERTVLQLLSFFNQCIGFLYKASKVVFPIVPGEKN
jgi:hypothetical protein